MGVSIEKPITGVLKLGTSLEFGEEEESEEYEEGSSSGKSNSRVHGEEIA